jgi:hypothetical protein
MLELGAKTLLLEWNIWKLYWAIKAKWKQHLGFQGSKSILYSEHKHGPCIETINSITVWININLKLWAEIQYCKSTGFLC